MIPYLLRCQEFAVTYYGFTLGRLGSRASSTFVQLRHYTWNPSLLRSRSQRGLPLAGPCPL